MQIRKLSARYHAALKAISLRAPAVIVASASMSELLMSLIAVLAFVLGAWRLGADRGWTSRFLIADGFLSRYQLWFAVAIIAQTSARILNRWVANQHEDLPSLAP